MLRLTVLHLISLIFAGGLLELTVISGSLAMEKKALGKVEYQFIVDERYANHASIPIRFRLRNLSSRAIRILKWNTLFEPISGDILSIRCNNELLQYQGPVIKREHPSGEDYAVLPPEEQLETSDIDLAEVYAFPERGECVIDLKPLYLSLAMKETPASSEVEINGEPASFKIG